ncbi:hypothetical protein DICVIV_08474 [Dictyocaulus viviparus]|uniref:Uncharacterized protein n=1 Tax=Dictyocaulus viviparus TaxID=29172 RepID=A0A0D8XSW3_DICVI|nr:hypothetical protein DICVIV_08474 [Dictyocaulus viviparus]
MTICAYKVPVCVGGDLHIHQCASRRFCPVVRYWSRKWTPWCVRFFLHFAISTDLGEIMVFFFPKGMRGPNGPPIYPGLYAVVGAAAYTGAVTHTLSVAMIICELTGQLAPILPVLKLR